MAQFGTGENVLGDTSAITRALERRGLAGTGALDQMSAASPGGQPPTPPSIPTGSALPTGVGAAPTGAAALSPEMAAMAPAGNEEAMLIVKALNDRLKAISNAEQAQVTPQPTGAIV